MLYRKFGKTDCMVSQLGFGAMRLPLENKEDDSAIDEKEAVAMIRHAIDSGVNYLDTAYFYHGGNSERVCGKALQDGYREKTYLASKLPMGEVNCREDFDRLLNEQLSKLSTDHIDFYLFHALNAEGWDKVRRFSLIEKMKEAKADGRIRHMGFSFHDDLKVFEQILDEYEGCEFCQIQLNYLDSDYQAGLEGLKKAHEMGFGVVIMEPLRGGALASPPDCVKRLLPENISPVQTALSYIWNMSEVTLLLSGMSNMQQLSENIEFAGKCTEGMLSAADIERLAAAKKEYDRQSLIPCTRCLYCQPCPAGVEIPDIFAAFNLIGSSDRRAVKEKMPDIEDKISLCVDCGKCEKKCPQNIKIRAELKRIKDAF